MRIRARLLLAPVCLLIAALAFSQVYCPRCGLPITPRHWAAARLKNRTELPQEADFDGRVTLDALLQPGDDRARWLEGRAAAVTGYVVEVKLAGVESANCFSPVRRDTHLSTLLLWLGPINLMVGLFNLVPAFPLDGGRILRSILWATTKNLRKATQWASGLGQLIAWLFIIGGVMMAFGVSLPLFGSGLASGLWLAFIGWFLNNAAINSRQRVLLQDLLEDVTVARLMRFDVVSVPPDMPVSSLVYDVMMNTDERSFPVMAEGRLIGMVCLQDIRKFPPAAWDQITVSRVMTPADQLAVTTPEENAGTALDKLTRRDVQQVPVVEEGRLVGLLRRRDILRWLQLQAELAA